MTAILSVALISCNGQTSVSIDYATVKPLPVQRFDKDLLHFLDQKDESDPKDFIKRYPQMLDVLGKAVLNMKSSDFPGFFDKLKQYYSEPTLRSLYQDAVTQYDSLEKIEKDLGYGFEYLKGQFPFMQVPAVYMHVSGLNQNVLVADSLLSLSIDKYLGEDYPLYQDFFYEFQKRKMCSALVVPDYISGWLMSEFPFDGRENVLLDRLIYEGKIKYVLSQSLAEFEEAILMGYTAKEIRWCNDHEAEIWKSMIERKHLYTPDSQTTSKYFEAAPLLFNQEGAPGNIGVWIGWQIIKKYMEETGSSVGQLMNKTDAQEILTLSKYRP